VLNGWTALMSTAAECVYAVTNEWIIVDTDGRDMYPFIHP